MNNYEFTMFIIFMHNMLPSSVPAGYRIFPLSARHFPKFVERSKVPGTSRKMSKISIHDYNYK